MGILFSRSFLWWSIRGGLSNRKASRLGKCAVRFSDRHTHTHTEYVCGCYYQPLSKQIRARTCVCTTVIIAIFYQSLGADFTHEQLTIRTGCVESFFAALHLSALMSWGFRQRLDLGSIQSLIWTSVDVRDNHEASLRRASDMSRLWGLQVRLLHHWLPICFRCRRKWLLPSATSGSITTSEA